MKIKRIEVHQENLELTRPYTIAYKTVDHVSNCIVRIESDTGLVGWGAANPSQAVVGVDVNDTVAALSDENTEWLIGADGRALYSLCAQVRQRFGGQPGAMAALDIALYDLFAQHLGIPLSQYLGQCHASLPTSITIGIKDVAATLAEAQEYVGRGFQFLKVKLGHSAEEDYERLAKLRERFGHDIVIRVDANQGYSLEELQTFYQQTLPLKLELIEQPLPVANTTQHRELSADIRQKIALDESLVTPADAWRWAADDVGDIFNIKLMKCGGITPARDIATIASGADIDLMWGCNDESIISIAAALHLALATPHTEYLDLDGSLDLARDVVSGGFTLKNGCLLVTDAPGLGVTAL